MDFSIQNLNASTSLATPVLILLGTGLLLMILDAFKQRSSLVWVSAAGMILSALTAWWMGPSESTITFFGMMEVGGIAPLVHVFLCVSGVCTLFFLGDYLKRQDRKIDDVYALLVFSVLGMILMANANDLIMTFIGLETMSMCLYIFAALYKTESRSNEAGLKYFLLGSFASAFLLFGISILYGVTGTTNFSILNGADMIKLLQENQPLFFTASGLIMVGFLFKVAAFPFHSWTPDVYTGTPTPLAGFMATGSKLAAFVAMGVIIQKLQLVSASENGKIETILALAALLTMVYGNIVAARQQNLKRMLAYSSIAHSGYILLGLCAATPDNYIGFKAIIFYMFIYTLMNIGAFGIVGMVEQQFEDTDLESWRGLGLKSPYLAGALAIFLFSLAGIPPLAGFMGKYQVFITAIRDDLVFLATIGILTSVIGAYYYIRVIVVMFFNSEGKQPVFNTRFSFLPVAGIAILVFLILLLGVFPGLVLTPIDTAFGAVVDTGTAMLGR
ncbi:MAG: NADH-quinone oxidoreductase subunit N [Bacteroidia bacterium]